MAVWDQGGQVGVLRLKLRTATASRTLTRKGRAVEVPARNMETRRSEICEARSRSEAKLARGPGYSTAVRNALLPPRRPAQLERAVLHVGWVGLRNERSHERPELLLRLIDRG